MRIKKIFAFLLAAALLTGLLPQTALAKAGDTFTIDSVGYKILSEPSGGTKGTVAVNDYDNDIAVNLTIPASFQYRGRNYDVTAIADSAFRGCSYLESVTIPYGVMSIGSGAFELCTSLDSVVLTDSITSIGNNAFSYSSLDGITIPNSVTSIGVNAFTDCDDLVNVVIPDGVTSIGDAAFANCGGLENVRLPSGITSISIFMFSECSSLTSVTIPDSVTTIGDYAFVNCSSLAGITIPGRVNTIGLFAFNGSGLVCIGIPTSVTTLKDNVFRNCARLMGIRFSSAAPPSFGAGVFSSAKSGLLVFAPKSSEAAYSSALAGKLPGGAVINPFVNPEGTEAAPFLIGTAEQLTAAAGLVNNDNAYFGDRYYQLTADIDLGATWTVASGEAALTGGTAWTPFGRSVNGLFDTAFRGTFDGQGNIIQRMYVNGSVFQGLFGMIDSGGVVKNVGLANSYIEGATRVGAIAGANSGTLKNCFSKNNTVTGANYTGGVVGRSDGLVASCYNTGAVTGTSDAAGGVVGYNGGILTDSYSVGAVSGTQRVGGISGVIDEDGQISNSYYCTQTIGTTNPPSSAVGIDHNSSYPDSASGKTMAELRALAPSLGAAFMQDSADLNNGYPVLAWEKGYLPLKGAGTEEEPYSIATAEQLRYMSLLVDTHYQSFGGSHYRLTADIDLGAAWDTDGTLTLGTPWTPIGSDAGVFCGSFDGQGHTISGLYINSPPASFQGLFKSIGTGSTVKNVGITDSYIKAKDYVGGIAGLSFNGTIANCYHTGAVSGDGYVGGILGMGTLDAVSGVYHAGSVSATGNYAGGLIGWNGGAFSNGYYNTDRIGSVNPPSSAVGHNDGTITNVSGKTSGYFADGEVAYLLQSGQSNPSVQVWGQALSGGSPDAAPVLTSDPAKHVLKAASFMNGAAELSAVYANTQAVTVTMPSPPGGMIWMTGGIGYEAGETAAVTHYTVFTAAALNYSITAIGDQTFAALPAGYRAGSQEEKLLRITKTGTGNLANLKVALSGTNGGSFSVTQPQVTLLNGTTPSTTFTVNAKDGLTAGTYTAVVTISATNLSPVSFNVRQVVNPAVLQSIAITAPAIKRAYTVGETLDISGLAVTGTYSDGSTRIETITTGNITGFDSRVPAASQTLAVTVGGKTATYTISINAAPPVNTIPTRRASVPATASASVTVNTAYTLDLATIFEDADGDPLTYKVSVNGGTEGTTGQAYTYIPVTEGQTTLIFKANDGTADSTDTYTVTLTASAVPPVNAIPNRRTSVPAAVTAGVTVNTVYTINLATIFEDADGDLLTYKVSVNGGTEATTGQAYTYTPVTIGQTTLGFKANDGTADSTDTYTVTLTATAASPVNTIPNRRASVPEAASASVTVNTAYALDLATIFEDADGDSLAYKVSVNGGTETTTGQAYTYTPVTVGQTTLGFKANDGTADSTDTYTVALTATTLPPSGSDAALSDLTVGGSTVNGFDPGDTEYEVVLPYGTQPGSIAALVGATTRDANADKRIFQAASLPGSATVEVTAANMATYRIYTVSLTLGGQTANTPPVRKSGVPAAAAASITVNTAYTLNLSTVFEDADSNPLTYKVSIDGTAAVPADQAYAYTPITTGQTILQFMANDGTVDSADIYTVTLTAIPIPANTPPVRKSGVPAAAAASVTVNTAYTLNLSAIFEDADANPLTYKVSVNGAAAVPASQAYMYTPVSAGPTALQFTANDGTADSADTYTVTLTATTLPPGSDAALSDLTVGGRTVNGFDPGDTEYEIVLPYGTQPGSIAALVGAAARDANASIIIIQAASLPGSATVEVTAANMATYRRYTVSMTLDRQPPNTLPVRKSGIPAATTAGVIVNTAYTLDLTTIFEDADANPLAYKVSVNGAAGVLASRAYTYTPVTAGQTTLIFKANDGTADSTDTYTVTLTANPATPQTYALVIAAGTGGSITTDSSGSYAAGTVINIAASASANYSFNRWTSIGGGTFSSTTSADTTFTMPANAVTITASFKYNNSGSVGGGSNIPSTPAKPAYVADVKSTDTAGNAIPATTLAVIVNKATNSAMLDISSRQGGIITGGGAFVITVPSIPEVTVYTLDIPIAYLSTPDGKGTLTFNTDTGSITLPADMLAGIAGAEGKKAEISIIQGEKAGLPEDAKAAIGDRPLIQLTVTIDGKQTEWNNPGAPVTISMPYAPTAAEMANSESIIIWYIDGSGKAVSVPNGRYDPVTGTVTFKATHFSYYAVGYNKVSFKDVAAGAWYSKGVGFIAARGIAAGTVNGNFSPDAKLTRGQFIIMLMKAYGIAPDVNPEDNFSDAGSTYYTGYLAAAKRLGISAGVGNNLFAPDREIARQDMLALVYNALKAIGQLSGEENGEPGESSDASGGNATNREPSPVASELTPTGTVTRAEMAQTLYNLLMK